MTRRSGREKHGGRGARDGSADISGAGQALPKPSKRRKELAAITVEPEIAAKLAVIEAFKAARITQGELATRLGKDGREVRRILDPNHATKLPALTQALEALGRRLVIGVEEIAA